MVLLCLIATIFGNAQRGIGTAKPDKSAILELKSTNKGFLLPRLSKTQLSAINEPAIGLMVYCLDCSPSGLYLFNGTKFKSIDLGTSEVFNVDATLKQIGDEADNPDVVKSVVTIAQLNDIVPALTGISVANEEGYQLYIDANPDLFSVPATHAEVQSMVNLADIVHNGLTYKVVTSPKTGKQWLDRNLGATQVATSVDNDANARGDLYQWGRNTDGHEKRNSLTTSTKSLNPGNKFVYTPSTPYDWRPNANQDDALWNSGTEAAPVRVDANDPCPKGFRVPTVTEWRAELFQDYGTNNTAYYTNATDIFNGFLKLCTTGYRDRAVGAKYGANSQMVYHTATADMFNGSYDITIGDLINAYSTSAVGKANDRRSEGRAIRCIKE